MQWGHEDYLVVNGVAVMESYIYNVLEYIFLNSCPYMMTFCIQTVIDRAEDFH